VKNNSSDLVVDEKKIIIKIITDGENIFRVKGRLEFAVPHSRT
jgi:hypothetical protein